MNDEEVKGNEGEDKRPTSSIKAGEATGNSSSVVQQSVSQVLNGETGEWTSTIIKNEMPTQSANFKKSQPIEEQNSAEASGAITNQDDSDGDNELREIH